MTANRLGKKHNHPQSSNNSDRLGQTWHCRCHRHKAFPGVNPHVSFQFVCVWTGIGACWALVRTFTCKRQHSAYGRKSTVTIYIQRYKRLPAQDNTQKPVTLCYHNHSQQNSYLLFTLSVIIPFTVDPCTRQIQNIHIIIVGKHLSASDNTQKWLLLLQLTFTCTSFKPKLCCHYKLHSADKTITVVVLHIFQTSVTSIVHQKVVHEN